MRERRKSYNTGSFISALLLLVIANTIMGLLLMMQSRFAVRTQIESRMLDIANTAADMLDGDALAKLTADDENTEPYQTALKTLSYFQDNIELEYIYVINAEPDGSFNFSIDPAIDDPGEFGAPIFKTAALEKAAQGTASVDKIPYEDEWGRFYSAYSPIFDSQGNVPVVVAVDFSAEWFENHIMSQRITVVIVVAVSLILGFLLTFIVASKNRKRFHELNTEMAELEKGFQKLNKTMMKSSIEKLNLIADDTHRELLQTLASGETYGKNEDEFSELGNNLRSMQKELNRYIKFLNSQTFLDPMTGVGNKSAYQTRVRKIDEAVAEKTADFTVAFFDINQLKSINTNYGFERGDELMNATAKILKDIFGDRNIYRIASDEFIAILENATEADMMQNFSDFDYEISEFNKERTNLPRLAVAKGKMQYQPDKMRSYRQAFVKAEADMRRDKAMFYESKKPAQEAF